MAEVNKDLQRERDKCSFNVQEMTTFIDGGKERTLERKQRGEIVVIALDA